MVPQRRVPQRSGKKKKRQNRRGLPCRGVVLLGDGGREANGGHGSVSHILSFPHCILALTRSLTTQFLHGQHGHWRCCHPDRRMSVRVHWPTRTRNGLLRDRPGHIHDQRCRGIIKSDLSPSGVQELILRPRRWNIRTLLRLGLCDSLCL